MIYVFHGNSDLYLMYLVCILYVTCILVSWRSTLTGSKPFTGIYQKSISHPQFIGRDTNCITCYLPSCCVIFRYKIGDKKTLLNPTLCRERTKHFRECTLLDLTTLPGRNFLLQKATFHICSLFGDNRFNNRFVDFILASAQCNVK